MLAKCDVVVVMGPKSNLNVMTQAVDVLQLFGVSCKVRVQESIWTISNDRSDLNERRKRHP